MTDNQTNIQTKRQTLEEPLRIAENQESAVALRLAVTQGHGVEADVAARASLLVSYVTGRWHRYAKSGFRQHPSDGTGVQLSLLLAA